VLEQLEQLDFDDDLPIEQRPFVELRIKLEKPEPGLPQQVQEAIANYRAFIKNFHRLQWQ